MKGVDSSQGKKRPEPAHRSSKTAEDGHRRNTRPGHFPHSNAFRISNLLHWPQILVKPIQRFLDEFIARKIVAGVVEKMFFLVVA